MKKRTLCFILCLLFCLCSCQNRDKNKTDGKQSDSFADTVTDAMDKIISTDPEPLRTVEYSVMYQDPNTGLPSYDTAILEQSEPISASFIFDKVIKLSGLPVSASSIHEENGAVTVDWDGSFFYSEQNNEKTESALLCSLYKSLIRNLDGIDTVYFGLDGGDFITDYHAFDSAEPFYPEKTEEPMSEVHTVPFTVSYYDIYTDENLMSEQVYRYVGQPDNMYYIEKISELYEVSIGVNSITVKNNAVTVDFDGEKAPAFGTGSYEESRILDCIADVLMQVIPEADAVYITKDGGAYDSGHIKLERDTPYATGKQNRIG